MGAAAGQAKEPLLVMEYMENGSLYDLVHNETVQLEGELLLPILRDVAQGIRFLHAASPQIIHGDLKAQNILVDSKFRAKVADFRITQDRPLHTIGTPYWMAPEVLRKEASKCTSAVDSYSFGIILYEVYSRQEPYNGEDYQTVIKGVQDPKVNKRPPVPQACPDKVQTLMTECLNRDPTKRPTFEELDLQLKRSDAATVAPGDTAWSKQIEKQTRTKNLLFEVFPKHVAEALRDGRKVEPEYKEEVTIFFSDIVNFTKISSSLSPLKVSDMLGRLYSRFDALSEKHDVFKVETIGDAYMAVTNLTKDQSTDHAERIAKFSMDAIEAVKQVLIDTENPELGHVEIRVGFHSGPVVANVVGTRNPRYCLFGDTVNMASRMESSSKKNRIHCSMASAQLVRKQCCDVFCHPRGRISLKGKGMVETYWVGSDLPTARGGRTKLLTIRSQKNLLGVDFSEEDLDDDPLILVPMAIEPSAKRRVRRNRTATTQTVNTTATDSPIQLMKRKIGSVMTRSGSEELERKAFPVRTKQTTL